MKLWYYYFTILLITLLLISVNINVCAINTGFSTKELTDNEKDVFFSNVNISVLKEEPIKQAIVCFDVNPNGKIAVGCSDFENKVICIYSQTEFLYGYEFCDNGSFGVEWDGDNINIYLVRSDLIVSVTPTGEIEGVLKVQNTIENNTYHNHILRSTERIVEDTKYKLQKDMGILNVFAPSYSQLVVTTPSGKDSVLYDVNSTYFIKMLCWCICITVFVLLVACVIIQQFIKRANQTRGTTDRPIGGSQSTGQSGDGSVIDG